MREPFICSKRTEFDFTRWCHQQIQKSTVTLLASSSHFFFTTIDYV